MWRRVSSIFTDEQMSEVRPFLDIELMFVV